MSLARFVPELVRRRIALDSRPPTAAHGEPFEAAVLFADISGFMPLTERLAASGVKGAEQLTNYLNRYFGELIDLVRAHGGEVLRFAGDALLAHWPSGDGDLALATRRAAAAALAMQSALHEFEVEKDVRLSMRVGLGAGLLHYLQVGGVLDRWEFFVSGEPMRQLQPTQARAGTGQVVCSPQAWALLQPEAQGAELDAGHVRLIAVSAERKSPSNGSLLSDDGQELLRSFVPSSVSSRYAHGQADWLGELRLVSVLFISVPELAESTSDDVSRAQLTLKILQRALYRFEGSINKISVDDKGVSVVGTLGLPPLAHEDDADRAVKAAVSCHEDLAAQGISSSIGVSTGTVFCGAVGNSARAEYTVMGDTVNLAARLMQRAEGGVLCEANTWRLARDTARFETLEPLAIKGKADAVQVYRPTGQFVLRALSSTHLVGREAEQEVLSERIQLLVGSKEGAAIVFEGDAGIGKSRLVAEALNQARAADAVTLLGAGDAIERATPYHAWRNVFAGLFGLGPGESREQAQQTVLDQLNENQRRLAPLLNAVLPLDLPDNELTGQMTGVVRSDNTDAFLVGLIAAVAERSPLVLILEDAHWMDSLSWTLVVQVVREIDSLLVVLSTRPHEAVELANLVGSGGALHHVLQPLSGPATLELVRTELGVRSLPDELGELIQTRAEGNPYFSGELATALRESGAIRIVGDRCEVPGGRGSLNALQLPDTVQGVVTSRVDRLGPTQQLTLKVAAVLGRTFSLRMVSDLFPVEADRPGLDDTLVELCETGLLLPYIDGSAGTQYTFKHALTQEAIYALMLFAQRRDLHCRAAEWLESETTDDPDPQYGRLAHHWLAAEEWPRAVDALTLAGQRAVRESSNREAIERFTQARALDLEHGLGHDATTRGTWHARILDAWFAAGRLDEAREAGLRALSLLGEPFPTSPFATNLAFMTATWRRIAQAYVRGPFRARGEQQALVSREAAHLCLQIMEICFYSNDPTGGLVAGFRTINLAERVDDGPELARGLAMMGAAMDLFMLPGVGDRWCARALAIAEQLGDRSTSSYVLSRVGAKAIYGADWPRAMALLERGAELSAELGEKRLWEECVSIQGKVLQYQGRFAEAEARWREVTKAALRRDAQQIIAWGQLSVAYNLTWQGKAAEAREFMAPELARASDSAVDYDLIWAHGIHAQACLADGDPGEALASADKALDKMSTSQPYPYFMFQSISEVTRVYVRLLEGPQGLPEASLGGLEAKARAALKNLAFMGRFFPFVRPSALLQEGTLAWLTGHPKKARKRWTKALKLAEAKDMALEARLARTELERK